MGGFWDGGLDETIEHDILEAFPQKSQYHSAPNPEKNDLAQRILSILSFHCNEHTDLIYTASVKETCAKESFERRKRLPKMVRAAVYGYAPKMPEIH